MEQVTVKPTEIICYPDSMEFGGLVWTRDVAEVKRPRFNSRVNGVGDVMVWQYGDESSARNNGRWYWVAYLDSALIGVELTALNKNISGIVDDIETAMECCINAKSIFVSDTVNIFRTLFPDSESSQFFRAGQADIKARIAEVLQ